MKFQAVVLLLALFAGVATAQSARRELRNGNDDGRGGRGGKRSKTIPLSYTTLIRSGQAVNQGVRWGISMKTTCAATASCSSRTASRLVQDLGVAAFV
jgi:hypothetical protein